METTENPTPEVTNTSKTHYETLDEKITKMKTTFANATLEQIFVVMVTVGYTAEKLADMNAKLNRLIELNAAQIKEKAEQTAEQKKFDDLRAKVNTTFNTHRGLLRILFKGNVLAKATLQLDVQNPAAYGNWNQLVEKFYIQLADPALLAQTATIGITGEVVAAQQLSLKQLDALKDSIIKESAEAQMATDTRDQAFDELYPLWSDYVKYAKLLLPDNQLLEAIGVRVRAQ